MTESDQAVVKTRPGRNGGRLTVGGKPGQGNMVKRLFAMQVEDPEVAKAVWDEYFRLCLHARSEELRAKMLMDMLDRTGVPRDTSGSHSPAAVAQVVNIIRNSPELGV